MIGSISKSFAAIVVLQEVEAGRLDLHVSVNELLPWLELPEPFGPITLHHLLTHTSGLAAGTEDAPTGLGVATLLRERAADVRSGRALLVLERRVQARGARAGARDLDAGARADPSARAGAARHDLVGGGDHGGHPDRSRHGLRAGVHRPSGAAAPPLGPGDLHGLEHGRRLHRVERDRHGRARALAAEPRPGADRHGPVGADVRRADDAVRRGV